MVKTKGLCKRHYDHWWKTTKRGRVPRVTPQHAHLATDGAALSWEAADEAMRIGWLAGLLEGEATFRAARYGTVYSPRVQLPMTDRDVLEKAMTLMPGARIYERKDPRAITRGWRQSWIVAVNGECAAAVMSSVRPWMGTRRGSQIDRALGLWNPIRLRHPPPTCVVEGCGKPHESRGLCHKHYMSWSRDRKKGRVPRVTPLR